RRPVRDEDVGAGRDLSPRLGELRPIPGEVERPVVEERHPRRAPERKPGGLGARVLEERGADVADALAGGADRRRSIAGAHTPVRPRVLERPVVVAGDDDLVRVGEGGEPPAERRPLAGRPTRAGVAGEDEDVAVGDGEGAGEAAVLAVGVGEADEAGHPGLLRWGSAGSVPSSTGSTSASG